jgi:hypothetical protein
VRRTFQRRKLESNWNQYDEETPVDYAKETKQKEDEFQQLLTTKGRYVCNDTSKKLPVLILF